MTTVTITRGPIRVGKEPVVILSLKEYHKLCKASFPTYQLKGKAATNLDKLVKEGMKEYRAGKCKTIKSLADLD